MHDAAQFVDQSLSPHARRETRTHDCGSGRERGDPIPTFGRGVAVQTDDHDVGGFREFVGFGVQVELEKPKASTFILVTEK